MRVLLGTISIIGGLAVIQIVLSLGLGWILHWIVSAIDMGHSTLIALVALIFATYLITQATMNPFPLTFNDDEALEKALAPEILIVPPTIGPRRRRRKR